MDFMRGVIKKFTISSSLKVACSLQNDVYLDCYDKDSKAWTRMSFGKKFISQFEKQMPYLKLLNGEEIELELGNGSKWIVTLGGNTDSNGELHSKLIDSEGTCAEDTDSNGELHFDLIDSEGCYDL